MTLVGTLWFKSYVVDGFAQGIRYLRDIAFAVVLCCV